MWKASGNLATNFQAKKLSFLKSKTEQKNR